MSGAVAVVIVTRNRPADFQRCLASVLAQTVPVRFVVVDNYSDGDKRPTVPGGCTLLHTEEALGAAAAKNLAFQQVHEPISVLLDDDAELASPDALERVVRVFAERPDAAVLALNCQVVGAGRPALEQLRLVHGVRDTTPRTVVAGEAVIAVAEFVGAGCAFRTAVFHSVGGFCGEYLYGYEEFHLSLRLMDLGHCLLYLPDVRVLHHQSTAWRLPPAIRLTSRLGNKWALAAELMPAPWIPVVLVPFTAHMLLLMTKRRVGIGAALMKAVSSFAHAWRHRRRPIRRATLREALALRGRL